jgi:rubrerythrin
VNHVFAGVRFRASGFSVQSRGRATEELVLTDDTQEPRGEAEPINWACTNCGYRVEGELPEKCPDCGADKEMFDEVPVPGF